MTIDEAIKGLQDEAGSPRYNFDPKRRQSLKLGIEALKQLQHIREGFGKHYVNPLPGETED